MSQSVLARVARQSSAYALASVVGPGTGLLLLPVYTRYLSPAEYGLIAMLEVIALVLSAVFSLGLPALVPFLYVDREGVERKRALGTLVIAVTAINMCLAALAWISGHAISRWLFPSVPFWPYLPLVILTALIEPYWIMAGASLQIQEKAARFAAWSSARVVVSVAVRIAFVVVLIGGAVGFTVANLVTAGVFCVAALGLLRTEIAPGFAPGVVREAFRVGGPTVPNNLLSYGFRLLDRVVLERFVTLEQVGLYYLAIKLADVMRLAGDVLINAWRPVFFKEADDAAFRTLEVPRVIRVGTIVLAMAFVGISVFAREVVMMFAAPAYHRAYVFVPLLTGAMFLKSFQSFPYLAIWHRRKTAWVPLLSALTLAVSVAANLIFARQWGAMGVAGALGLSYLFLTIMMLLVARRLYAAPYPWRALAIVVGLGLCAIAVSVALPDGSTAIVAKIMILLSYAVALVVTGCVQRSELRALRPAHGIPALLRGKTAAS